MMDWLVWLENTELGIWVRESGTVWSYPTILFLHTAGLAFVVGTSTTIALRLLGVAREVPLAPLVRLYPVLWAGFWVNLSSGVLLLVADATTKLTSPVFYIKMACVTGAVVVMMRIRRVAFRPDADATGAGLKALAAVALLLWVAAVVAGRLMAYFGPVSGID